VVFGYQPAPGDDGEPDGEGILRGGTPQKSSYRSHGFSVIYTEAIRDHTFEKHNGQEPDPYEFNQTSRTNFLTNLYLQRLYGVIAHEISHGPGKHHPNIDHAENGIMDKEAGDLDTVQYFPRTLLRFRSATSWTD
jgi:hypothetical protein